MKAALVVVSPGPLGAAVGAAAVAGASLALPLGLAAGVVIRTRRYILAPKGWVRA
jgi:hypothetical protein